MKRLLKGWLSLLSFAAFLAAPQLSAQTATTGALSGLVSDEQGGVLPGANVQAVHEPTGTRYEAVTGSDGRFSILNVRVGPYTVSIAMSGFKPQKMTALSVALGEDRNLSFKLKLESVAETIEVTADAASVINPASTGPASNVSQDTIESLPTIDRGLEDFARLSPYFDAKGSGDGTERTVISVAGRNNRYNNIQIDGAVNNDLFAISDSSAPGNGSDGQPISIDAIQELQLVVAPYDVRQGGFTGGGVNAVTRSGSNSLRGTAYYYFRNESFTGDGPDSRPLATFSDKQFGASLGGPIKKDKAFFFGNVDWGRRETPSGFSADGSSGQNFGQLGAATRPAEIQRFLSILRTRYGYDAGGTTEFIRNAPSNKAFGRLDLNLTNRHRLTVRHNYIKGETDRGFPSSTVYYFPDNWYQPRDNINSSVVQLNSTFGHAVNELRITYQRIRTVADGPTRFPQVIVDLSGGGQLRAGRENFRHANELDQDIVEFSDDFTFTRGPHTISLGTHNEFFKFRNLFIRDNLGNYRFNSLDNLEAGFAQQFDHSFSATSNPLQPARFKVNQVGFYAGDLWRAGRSLTLNLGVRADIPNFPDTPTANSAAAQSFGYKTDVVPSPMMLSPRVGFNWDVSGSAKAQVRGGIGLFTGRTPYVWLSNQYGNTGIEFTRIGASFNAANRIPFVPDPGNQPKVVTGATGTAFRNEVDVIDPDYKFPSVLRTNLAYDRSLFWNLVGTVEVFYSRTRQDIGYRNLNLRPSGQTRSDGRPVFTRVDTNFSDIILLENTDQGRQWTFLAKLERPFRSGVYVSGSWLYGESKSINDGTSSQAASNWGNVYVPGNPNSPPLARSKFDPGHRINLSLSKNFKLGGVDLNTALFYNGQTGRPYTFNFNGDANGDGRTTNDLLYVPRSADDVIIRNGTWDQLNAFIAADDALSQHRGSIVARNAGRSPWRNYVDLKLLAKVKAGGRVRFEVTADILNVANLLNSDWGVYDLATFEDLNPIRFQVDATTGKYIYDLVTISAPAYRKFDRDDLRSRWQGQLGFRVRF